MAEDKNYPGQLERYRDLKAARLDYIESFRDSLDTSPNKELIAAMSIAEELAGLCYVLDGIRYAARKS